MLNQIAKVRVPRLTDGGFPPIDDDNHPQRSQCDWVDSVCTETPTHRIVWVSARESDTDESEYIPLDDPSLFCARHYAVWLARLVESHNNDIYCDIPPFDHIYQYGKIGKEKVACAKYDEPVLVDFFAMLKEESYPDVPDVADIDFGETSAFVEALVDSLAESGMATKVNAYTLTRHGQGVRLGPLTTLDGEVIGVVAFNNNEDDIADLRYDHPNFVEELIDAIERELSKSH